MDQELFAKFLKGDMTAFNQLMRLHQFRIDRLATQNGFAAQEISSRVQRSLQSRRSDLSPAPSFLHWLYLFTLKELREQKTGETGFTGLFETPEEEFKPTQSFSQELSKYLEWMTDDKMDHYRMRFEDGLVFEEMAALISGNALTPKTSTPWTTWLEDWRLFQTEC